MKLPEATGALWSQLSTSPQLYDGILIGGTALALHLEHRASEDLDFLFLSPKLPRSRIDTLLEQLHQDGFRSHRDDSPEALDDFSESGMDLLDYQQNLIVQDGVKVTFFTADANQRSILEAGSERVRQSSSPRGPRIADLDELFALKCLVAATRSNTRDWFDLYTLMTEENFSIEDFSRVFESRSELINRDIALKRLCSGTPSPNDPGYRSLIAKPLSVGQMAGFFRSQRDKLEQASAKASLTPQLETLPERPGRRVRENAAHPSPSLD